MPLCSLWRLRELPGSLRVGPRAPWCPADAPLAPLSHPPQNLRVCEANKREVSAWKPRLRQMSSAAASSAPDADPETAAELQRLVENLTTAEVSNAGVKDMLHQMIVRAADKAHPEVRGERSGAWGSRPPGWTGAQRRAAVLRFTPSP